MRITLAVASILLSISASKGSSQTPTPAPTCPMAPTSRGVVEVTDFGAQCDCQPACTRFHCAGESSLGACKDDSAAIQCAINSVAPSGGTIHFPRGICWIKKGLKVPGDRTVNLVGEGSGFAGDDSYLLPGGVKAATLLWMTGNEPAITYAPPGLCLVKTPQPCEKDSDCPPAKLCVGFSHCNVTTTAACQVGATPVSLPGVSTGLPGDSCDRDDRHCHVKTPWYCESDPECNECPADSCDSHSGRCHVDPSISCSTDKDCHGQDHCSQAAKMYCMNTRMACGDDASCRPDEKCISNGHCSTNGNPCWDDAGCKATLAVSPSPPTQDGKCIWTGQCSRSGNACGDCADNCAQDGYCVNKRWQACQQPTADQTPTADCTEQCLQLDVLGEASAIRDIAIRGSAVSKDSGSEWADTCGCPPSPTPPPPPTPSPPPTPCDEKLCEGQDGILVNNGSIVARNIIIAYTGRHGINLRRSDGSRFSDIRIVYAKGDGIHIACETDDCDVNFNSFIGGSINRSAGVGVRIIKAAGEQFFALNVDHNREQAIYVDNVTPRPTNVPNSGPSQAAPTPTSTPDPSIYPAWGSRFHGVWDEQNRCPNGCCSAGGSAYFGAGTRLNVIDFAHIGSGAPEDHGYQNVWWGGDVTITNERDANWSVSLGNRKDLIVKGGDGGCRDIPIGKITSPASCPTGIIATPTPCASMRTPAKVKRTPLRAKCDCDGAPQGSHCCSAGKRRFCSESLVPDKCTWKPTNRPCASSDPDCSTPQ